jgi:glycosyltransferase involved in cell wall biosynthesis
MKVALVHDYLNQYGGAERVLQAISDLYPDAPIYTSIYDEKKLGKYFAGKDIRTTFMQKLPFALTKHQMYLLAYPFAFEGLDLREYDLVISDSSAFAKGVITGPNTLHICYCHSPMRFAWDLDDYAKRENFGTSVKALLPFIMGYVRLWDVSSAVRPDVLISNSRIVSERIRKFWGREAVVINPPVEISRIPYTNKPRGEFYLATGRLVPYKRIDVTVEAFKRLGLPLKVVGAGRDMNAIKKLAGANTEILGYVSDEELVELYNTCRAFVQVGAEDFGITPIEAMAGGAPVVAINKAGPAETIVDGVTGLFFEEQSPESLIEAVQRFERVRHTFDHTKIRKHAETFDSAIFAQRFRSFVFDCWRKFSIARNNGAPAKHEVVVRNALGSSFAELYLG